MLGRGRAADSGVVGGMGCLRCWRLLWWRRRWRWCWWWCWRCCRGAALTWSEASSRSRTRRPRACNDIVACSTSTHRHSRVGPCNARERLVRRVVQRREVPVTTSAADASMRRSRAAEVRPRGSAAGMGGARVRTLLGRYGCERASSTEMRLVGLKVSMERS